MNVLITGGLGVIGSRLAETLQASGHNVIILDTPVRKQENYIRADVCSMVETMQAFKKWPIDFVFHFAGEVGRENGELFARRAIDINVSGTMNMLQLCRDFSVPMIYASTSEIYGNQYRRTMTEDMFFNERLTQTNCYALSKYQAETYIDHFVRNYNTKAISLRFFMCYGVGEYPSWYRSAMSRFIYNLLTNRPITVHQNTVRSWCYIDDIVNGCKLAMEKASFKPPYKAYNIGRSDSREMQDVAELCCSIIGANPRLVTVTKTDSPFITPIKVASFDKAKRELGYASFVPLQDGIRMTVQWQREHVVRQFPNIEC